MANGKGIFDVKLKHIVSSINLSMASSLCLSDSRAFHATSSNKIEWGKLPANLGIYIHLPNECLRLEGFLGKSNGIRSRQDVLGFLEGVVHFR